MILKKFELNNFDFNKFNIYLFYGKNDGLQEEIIKKYFIEKFDGAINKYDEQEILNNKEIIIEGVLNNSLFEEEKLIIITRSSDKIINFIKEISDRNLSGVKIIIRAGILEKKSKLRSYFEKDKNFVCLPFYEDDNSSLLQIINQFLKENKIIISRESINLIINRSSGNRHNLKNELNKILSYSFTSKQIDIDVIKKLTNLSENYDVSELTNNYLEKNTKKVSKILNENNYSDEDCVLILRTLLNKSKRLLNIIERYKSIKNIEDVISSTKPPIFWKEKETIKKQAISWKINDLKSKIYKINEIELLIKNNSKNSLNLVSDFIVNY
tara:strand:+ start:911 stop:1888 length:978 start_codon:yes stop_codon:yes gene_type:complete